MRLGPIEIAWSPRRFNSVWNRTPMGARNMDHMTPTELRSELKLLHGRMLSGVSAYIPSGDKFQTIHFFNNNRKV